ncbi:Zinc C2H2 protein [Pleurostoma richardsiae]|uniref:Zinc C2H2 protein n=1 Tax=Pleurostoma richardsiae TaxID=41990 RepID=A0AA38VPE7_9PEZI|nr:Zinc C2H2 protein [Pleurostoma richardsiae]
MAFLEDPRLRQRWNQISHTTEAVTENAAAGIWTFQHRYIHPCLSSVGKCFDACTAPCFGDREERARRARERERGARGSRAEFNFDFYDDWDDDDELLASGDYGGGGGGGLLGSWGGSRAEDWDRLLAGTGSSRSRHTVGGGEATIDSQPRRKRGMSYGTRGARRKNNEEEDPTIIPSTAPLGFLGRLPWKIGGTLRYKPSAANLQDNPGGAAALDAEEHRPLLGAADGADYGDRAAQTRKRSSTTGSGDTSDSYRSRGDLFPSDEEGEEDAVPIDDEFAVTLGRIVGAGDDRSSGKTRSSSGKRPAGENNIRTMSRTVSIATLSSDPPSRSSLRDKRSSASIQQPSALENSFPSLEDLHREEEEARREEDQEVQRKRQAAAQLALARGLSRENLAAEAVREMKAEIIQVHDIPEAEVAEQGVVEDVDEDGSQAELPLPAANSQPSTVESKDEAPTEARQEGGTEADEGFVPARLPRFR